MGLKSIASSALCIAFIAGECAYAADTREEKGRKVVDDAIAALGGDAFLHMQDRLETGRAYSFYNSQMSGASPIAKIYTRYLPPSGPLVAGKMLVEERQSFGDRVRGKFEERYGFVLFTAVPEAWEVTFRGARPLPDDQLSRYRDTTLHNVLYMLRERLKEPEVSFYSLGSDIFDNRPVNIVQIACAENMPVTVYFDQSTKLPTRQTYKRRNEEYHDMDTEVTSFARYRDAGGGVQWPHDVRRERNGEKIYEMFSESVEINKGFGDELFRLPANARVLQKSK
ncbi:MAG TPA: hypothetical protein VHW24_04635 [Bryobacteraceae bacterium]|jgi:hypothetical protein|nr:hypothetical protein [Bryobacteraceae bacterium]